MNKSGITELGIEGVLLVQLKVYADDRGWFQEFWNQQRGLPGSADTFVQDNHAVSKQGVLRGLHYQEPFGQGKLITVLHGTIFDVAVDVRRSSKTFGKSLAITLEAGTGKALYIPVGFAHGYQTLSESAAVVYSCTDTYHPEAEHTLLWNDPALAIAWPLDNPVLSEKDRNGRPLSEITAAP